MKITKKRKYIILCLSILIIAISGMLWKQMNDKKAAEINAKKNQYEVKKGDITVFVKASGTTKLANQQKLSFGKEGKITSVSVDIGDDVKTGDILAYLDMDEYNNNLKSAELELKNTQLALGKLLNNDTSLKEKQINNQIEQSKSTLNIETEKLKLLRTQLNTIMEQKENLGSQYARDYKSALKNLEIAKSNLDIHKISKTEETNNSLAIREQSINNIISSLKVTLGEIEGVIETIDKIFGASGNFQNINDLYEHLLSVKDSQLKVKTSKYIQDGYELIKNLEGEINNINTQTDTTKLYNFIESIYERTSFLIDLCDTALDAIDKSSEGANLTEETLATFQTSITLSRTSVVTIRTRLETLASNLSRSLSADTQNSLLALSIESQELEYTKQENALKTLSSTIQIYVDEVKNLRTSHNNQLIAGEANLNSLRQRISLYEEELKDLLDGPNKYDVTRQRNLVQQAKLRKDKIEQQLKKYQIVAEFDGRIRSIDIIEGEQFKLDDRKYIVIENPNLIELELQLNQIDIVRVAEGNEANITFDAYPNNSIKAKINEKNVNPEPNDRGGVYYKANIFLEKQEKELLAGMSAIVNITADTRKDIIVVPTLSLIYKGDKIYVSKKIETGYKLVEVETGINNNFEVEITKGLHVGDIIQASVLDKKALKEMGIDESSSEIFGE